MAELQSQSLNDLNLDEKVSTTEQISAFVIESVKNASGDSALSNLTFGYDSEEKQIKLGTIDGETLGTVDCTDFIVDGMISSVEYDETSHTLSIAWNTDAGSKTTEINLSGLVDVYTAGEGLTCENGVFSLTANIPSAVSELKNDSGYTTSAYVDDSCQSLSGDITGWAEEQIEENAGNRVFIDNRISGVFEQSDLSVVKLSSNEYDQLVVDGTAISNCLYVVEDQFNNMYGQQVKNMAAGTDLSDAVTLGQVDKKFDDMFECLSAVRQYDSSGNIPLSVIIDAVWRLSKLQNQTSEND